MTKGSNPVFTDGPILNNGIKMPWLGLGVWQINDGEEVINAVKSAINLGYRSIDTAYVYKNETGVGQAIRDCGVPRKELFITTKLWNSHHGYESALKAFEKSRQKLGVDVIDLYLIHWAVPDKHIETWKALVHLYEQGVVRAIGVANYQIHHLEQIINDTGIVPAVNQVELHPLLNQQELRQFCCQHGIQIEAWSPLMQGSLDHPVIANIAAKYGKTNAQIVLRWDFQNGVIIIPKSVHEERIKENSQIFDFEISSEDMMVINQLNQNRRFGLDPDNVNF